MRWWIKILFGLLLAFKLTPSMAQRNADKPNDTPISAQQDQGKDHLEKPMPPGEGCLVEERISQQIEFHFRWPIQILLFTNNGVQASAEKLLTQQFKPLAKVPLQHFYRTLLFPFHSNT